MLDLGEAARVICVRWFAINDLAVVGALPLLATYSSPLPPFLPSSPFSSSPDISYILRHLAATEHLCSCSRELAAVLGVAPRK